MADGYARVSKRPGVMIAQNGPAATLVVAAAARSAQVLHPAGRAAAGDPAEERGQERLPGVRSHPALFRLHQVDAPRDHARTRGSLCGSGLLPPPARAVPARRCCSSPTTCSTCPPRRPRARPAWAITPLDRGMPGRDAIEDVAKALLDSRNPVIIAGGGVHLSSACEAPGRPAGRVRFAGGDHRHGQGQRERAASAVAGRHGQCPRPLLHEPSSAPPAGRSRLRAAGGDAYRPERHGTPGGCIPRARALPISTWTAPKWGRNYEAQRLVGDARLTLEALAEIMRGMDAGKRRAARAALEARIAEGRKRHEEEMRELLAKPFSPMHPAQVMDKLQQVVTPDSIVVADASFSSIWVSNNLRALKCGQRFITPRGMAGLGWGLPMAIGAGRGSSGRSHLLRHRRRRLCPCLVGDGSGRASEAQGDPRGHQERRARLREDLRAPALRQEQHLRLHVAHRPCGHRPGLRL